MVPGHRRPFINSGAVVRRAGIDGTSMQEWFRHTSPSRWMRGVINEVRLGVQGGWEATRLVAMDAVSRLVTNAADSGLCSSGNGTLQRNGVSSDLRWYTLQDKVVCPVCRPLNGKRVSMHGSRQHTATGQSRPKPAGGVLHAPADAHMIAIAFQSQGSKKTESTRNRQPRHQSA